MKSVTALEAKTRFGELLERVIRGEEIVITRHAKAVARIVPEGAAASDEVRRAGEALFALQEETRVYGEGRTPKDWPSFKKLVEEGRK